jgi:predicted NUDIX family NTP pyrophosphohydrolase
MPLRSAGILLYRRTGGVLEVLLTHPGGPFWRNRDAGAWMIPKGHVEEGEDAAACAVREFEEELGSQPIGVPRPLCRIRQKGGKWVEAFALEGDMDADAIVSNHYHSEWPPRSGRFRPYPEVDKAAWFTLERAREMMLESQLPILDALEADLAS